MARSKATVLVVSLCCILLFSAASLARTITRDGVWQEWKIKYDKVYSGVAEEKYRRDIWERNVNTVEELNSRVNASFTTEINHLADVDIYNDKHLLSTPTGLFSTNIRNNNACPTLLSGPFPKSFDWRQQGVVGPVRNQGQTGTSVDIAITEGIESLHAIPTKQLLQLSEEEVEQCCPGQIVSSVLDCIVKLGGLCTEADYPPSKNRTCNAKHCTVAVPLRYYKNIVKGNEISLQTEVLYSPTIAVVDASHTSFQLYRSGIYREPKCSTTRVDHALLVVGYGTNPGQGDYWICQNSWGTNWGMEGYILIARNQGNMCGIASYAVRPC